MASVMKHKAISLLIFISVLQGIQSISTEQKAKINATVGQNISLPCIMPEQDNIKIIQIQWNKEEGSGEQILVLYNPSYSFVQNTNFTLELVNDTTTMELRGSILHLQEVTEKDSGQYVCHVVSFPHGSIKNTITVQITVPKISVMVMPPNRTVIEGDTVIITCVCDPLPEQYILLSSLGKSIMQSQDGKFTIANMTRHISDLICQPVWSSSNQHLESLKATVNLTVDFIDNIECNSESQIQVETGTNLTITCDANSSRSLVFAWTKNNMMVSSSASINLWSVNPDHSGIYTLTVHAKNHNLLHRQMDFSVTVMNRTHTGHLSSTMTMETTPQMTSTTMTTHEPSTRMSTSQPQNTNSTTDTTSTEEVTYNSTSTPSTGNITMVHLKVTTPHMASTFTPTSSQDRTLSELCCTSLPGSTNREVNYRHKDTSTVIYTSASISKAAVTISNTIAGEDETTTKSHMVCVIIPVLLWLLLIAFLYRQYLVQKRLDMPPPFKPPPPPVKYTSARTHDILITDILV